MPDVAISVDRNNICAGTPVKFTATYQDAGDAPAFRWLVNGVPTDSVGLTYISSTLNNSDSVATVIYSSAVCSAQLRDTSNAIVMNIQQVALPVIKLHADKDTVMVNEPFAIRPDTMNMDLEGLMVLY
jgi:hypothetical protein